MMHFFGDFLHRVFPQLVRWIKSGQKHQLFATVEKNQILLV
jgi:hypothetical protein